MLSSLGRLWLAGVDTDLGAVGAGERRRRVSLPGYPFRRDRHWIDLPAGHPGTPPASVMPPTESAMPPLAVVTTQSVPGRPAPDDEYAVVAGVWRELLGVPEVGPDDDFFELGGHSLLATMILARISELLDVRLPPASLFEAPTVRGLAELARSSRDRPEADDETAQILAEVRGMSEEQLRAELDREDALWADTDRGAIR
jgi:acyl carrier protein